MIAIVFGARTGTGTGIRHTRFRGPTCLQQKCGGAGVFVLLGAWRHLLVFAFLLLEFGKMGCVRCTLDVNYGC